MNLHAKIALCFLLVCLSVAAFAKDDDRVQFNRSITVETDETVNGDVVCIGCPITVLGHVTGDAVSIGSSIRAEGSVDGDAVAVGGSIQLGPTAHIGKDVTTIGGTLQRDPAASVGGEVESVGPGFGGHGIAALGAMVFFGSLLFLLPFCVVLTLLCYAIAGQRRIDSVAIALRTRTGYTILAGILSVVAAIVLTILFSHLRPISGLLIFLVWLGLFLASILGFTGLSAWIGRRISATAGPLAIILIGAIVVALLQAIPIFGCFIGIVFILFALGGAIATGYGTSPNWLEQRMGPRR
jgi:hypothetical protein